MEYKTSRYCSADRKELAKIMRRVIEEWAWFRPLLSMGTYAATQGNMTRAFAECGWTPHPTSDSRSGLTHSAYIYYILMHRLLLCML